MNPSRSCKIPADEAVLGGCIDSRLSHAGLNLDLPHSPSISVSRPTICEPSLREAEKASMRLRFAFECSAVRIFNTGTRVGVGVG